MLKACFNHATGCLEISTQEARGIEILLTSWYIDSADIEQVKWAYDLIAHINNMEESSSSMELDEIERIQTFTAKLLKDFTSGKD